VSTTEVGRKFKQNILKLERYHVHRMVTCFVFSTCAIENYLELTWEWLIYIYIYMYIYTYICNVVYVFLSWWVIIMYV